METPKAPADKRYHEAFEWLASRTSLRPKIGIVCGSGLGRFAETLEEPQFFEYKDIPHFPVSTVPGHKGRLVFGKVRGKNLVCMQGRFHLYEGYPANACAFPIRLFKLFGVEKLTLTNAAGGLNPAYKMGDFMIMKDHINLPGLVGVHPMIGERDLFWGPRFTNMFNCYDAKLRKLAKEIASEINEDRIQEGVYQCITGPSYETVAEMKMAQSYGVDALGMSTVYEVLAARQCGLKCLAISLITNECKTSYKEVNEVSHEEVVEVADKRGKAMVKFITEIISRW